MDRSKPISLSDRSKNFGPIRPKKRDIEERHSSYYDGPIVCSDGFRAGFPELSQLPMEIEIPPPNEERIAVWSQCSSKVAIIAQQGDLTFDEIHVTMTKGKSGILHPTIIIRVPGSEQKLLWQPTLINIGKMLHAEGSLQMYVLIIASQDEKEDHAYIITPDHPIVRLWAEKISRPVLKVLESTDFVELCVWNWGVTEEAAKPTVVIVVEDKQECDWNVLVERIHEIYTDCGASYLKVVVKEGRQYQSTSQLDQPNQGYIEGQKTTDRDVRLHFA